MSAKTDSLTSRMEELISSADRRLAAQLRQSTEDAQRQQQRVSLFNELASDILNNDIAVRVSKLAQYFPHASVELIETVGTYGAICRFQHTVRFPATVELRLTCAHDDHVEHFLCSYNLELLPVFIKFDKHDQIASPLMPLDRPVICTWLDDRIVKFLETYLQLGFIDQYQRENQVTDPVSQVRISRAYAAAKASYKGHDYYFVSDQNCKLFEASPERYVSP